MQFFLAAVLILAAFYLLAIITEHFFVPSIDVLAHKLKLSSDASGATLLAMGSSAPEFFTSLIAILGLAGGDHADIGAGTIVGSAIFNVLVIVGAVALYKRVTLEWKPIMRDQAFYVLTIILLLLSFKDGRITLIEALVFVAVYLVYVFVVINWKKWFKYKETPAPDEVMPPPDSGLGRVVYKTFNIVIPDTIKKPKQYVTTFCLSVAVIAGLSFLLVHQIVVIADTLSINATFLALTVLAAGTSIPDLIGSVVVAKQGRGDMAVSNAIGSNIFDILFGLGVPWTIALLLKPGQIVVSTDNLNASVILLFATVVATLFLLIIRKWRIGTKSGLILVGLYVAYCIYIATVVI